MLTAGVILVTMTTTQEVYHNPLPTQCPDPSTLSSALHHRDRFLYGQQVAGDFPDIKRDGPPDGSDPRHPTVAPGDRLVNGRTISLQAAVSPASLKEEKGEASERVRVKAGFEDLQHRVREKTRNRKSNSLGTQSKMFDDNTFKKGLCTGGCYTDGTFHGDERLDNQAKREMERETLRGNLRGRASDSTFKVQFSNSEVPGPYSLQTFPSHKGDDPARIAQAANVENWLEAHEQTTIYPRNTKLPSKHLNTIEKKTLENLNDSKEESIGMPQPEKSLFPFSGNSRPEGQGDKISASMATPAYSILKRQDQISQKHNANETKVNRRNKQERSLNRDKRLRETEHNSKGSNPPYSAYDNKGYLPAVKLNKVSFPSSHFVDEIEAENPSIPLQRQSGKSLPQHTSSRPNGMRTSQSHGHFHKEIRGLFNQLTAFETLARSLLKTLSTHGYGEDVGQGLNHKRFDRFKPFGQSKRTADNNIDDNSRKLSKSVFKPNITESEHSNHLSMNQKNDSSKPLNRFGSDTYGEHRDVIPTSTPAATTTTTTAASTSSTTTDTVSNHNANINTAKMNTVVSRLSTTQSLRKENHRDLPDESPAGPRPVFLYTQKTRKSHPFSSGRQQVVQRDTQKERLSPQIEMTSEEQDHEPSDPDLGPAMTLVLHCLPAPPVHTDLSFDLARAQGSNTSQTKGAETVSGIEDEGQWSIPPSGRVQSTESESLVADTYEDGKRNTPLKNHVMDLLSVMLELAGAYRTDNLGKVLGWDPSVIKRLSFVHPRCLNENFNFLKSATNIDGDMLQFVKALTSSASAPGEGLSGVSGPRTTVSLPGQLHPLNELTGRLADHKRIVPTPLKAKRITLARTMTKDSKRSFVQYVQTLRHRANDAELERSFRNGEALTTNTEQQKEHQRPSVSKWVLSQPQFSQGQGSQQNVLNPLAGGDASLSSSAHIVSKRPKAVPAFSRDAPLPWACPSVTRWRDLGLHVFPRYVQETSCGQSISRGGNAATTTTTINSTTCWFGFYHCRPTTSAVQVLVRHTGSCNDSRVPQNIRRHYFLSVLNISTGCVCA